MFEIEKGIALADAKRGREPKYPFLAMEKGDSFFVEAVNGGASQVQQTLHACAYRHRPKRFAVRTVDGGVRCWRVE